MVLDRYRARNKIVESSAAISFLLSRNVDQGAKRGRQREEGAKARQTFACGSATIIWRG
jgi:hypothetical protein